MTAPDRARTELITRPEGPGRRRAPLSRRGLFAAGGALGLGALLTACSDDGDSGGSDGSGDGKSTGAWSFRDDRGETAKAKATPKRIVAYVASAAALHDFGIDCAAIYGPSQLKNGKSAPQAGSLDAGRIPSLGTTGQFSIEKYAALRPELLVANVNVGKHLWQLPEQSEEKILGFAPSVGIRTSDVSLVTAVQRYADLAQSLGADMKAKAVTDAKARFEQAAERLRKAAKANGGLRVLAVAAQPDALSAAVPDKLPDLRYYKELGVQLIVPKQPGPPGYWEKHSWENADAYRPDILFYDQRSNNMPLDEVARSKPTWNDLPAVKAGQVVPWNNEAQFTHAGYAPLMEKLADALEKGKKVG
ncbi:ABC transporter substrate-binding protein [Streptomyces sp. I05A-00742]|uniref:ABC transporter substrate-binding protein n=1 Tax=Streptomyces sp. I05A-00742 TaxID=2732853 RepID=UPI0028970F33|nr:ABC transporter substrate-binding protein [Streptomyces sp. I05A-00742]